MKKAAGDENTNALSFFADRIRRENAIESAKAACLHALAFDEACRLAVEMGKADPTLRTVMLFGSTLPGREYRINSDIDLAIRGGNQALLERVAEQSSFHIDIIAIEDARPGIKERIMDEGLVIYGTTEG